MRSHINEIRNNPIRNTDDFMVACSAIMGMRDSSEAREMIDWVEEQVSDWMVGDSERNAMNSMIEAIHNVIIDFEMMEVA
tara:strand:- start:8 stop:247 length:240 start_codon:yes stop_codon:yes gene_type:complete